MRTAVVFAALATLAAGLPSGARAAASGEVVYKRCAVCHLADGRGIPGAIPKLGPQLRPLAANRRGREYLVMTITVGRQGLLTIDDVSYQGYMPPQGLNDDEAAAVMNFIVGTLGGAAGQSERSKPFTVREVAKIRKKHAALAAAEMDALRCLGSCGGR